MTVLTQEILAQGQTLVQGLRREGRNDEAMTVDVLLQVAETVKQGTHFLTTGQVAERLGVSRQTIVNWVNRKFLPGIRLGGRLMIPASGLTSFTRIERILDELDAEHPPLSPSEAARLVNEERTNWTWVGKNT